MIDAYEQALVQMSVIDRTDLVTARLAAAILLLVRESEKDPAASGSAAELSSLRGQTTAYGWPDIKKPRRRETKRGFEIRRTRYKRLAREKAGKVQTLREIILTASA